MRLVTCAVFVATLISYGQVLASVPTPVGKLIRLEADDARPDEVRYQCELHYQGRLTRKIGLTVNVATRDLRIALDDDGAIITGTATKTSVADKAREYFYLENGFVPYRYRFTYSVQTDGSAAELQLAGGAANLICR